MDTRIIVAAAVLSASVMLIILVVTLRRRSKGRRGEDEFAETANSSSEGALQLQSGIAKVQLGYKKSASLHNSYHDFDKKKVVDYYVLGEELPSKPFLSWSDHPSLVSDAVEYGWARFGFAGQNITTTTTTGSVLLGMGLCISGDQVRESKAEVSWEICPGSAEFMQKVRLNSGFKTTGVSCATHAALPLPGPFLGISSFPQEAYFEITVLTTTPPPRDSTAARRISKDRKAQGEKTKLIQQVVDEPSATIAAAAEEGTTAAGLISVGLSVGSSHPQRLPGSYYGSIGFNSDGSIYLDGIKLLEKPKWENANRDTVIGCGFDPTQKKVFFSIDSELVHVIQCKSEEFGRPLYPTLAANIDATIIVNLGQSSFKYAPPNIYRTPDPCFLGSAAALGYEDSKELFSMGRIDSEWLNRCTTKSSINNTDNRKVATEEDESEADLFEIVLDNMRRSPSTYL